MYTSLALVSPVGLLPINGPKVAQQKEDIADLTGRSFI